MLKQYYDLYTAEDQHIWSQLYSRQATVVGKTAYPYFLQGLELLGFSANAIPRFDEVNRRLEKLTGWGIYAVPGLIDNALFFEQLQDKKFGATTWMRSIDQLDYLEEPDMFHDVYGHVPLLTDPAICDYLQGLADIASRYIDQEAVVEAIARLYWYTIEFGLIQTGGELKIYGAGILSSVTETAYAVSGKPRLERFDVEKIVGTPYIKDKLQEQYFVVYSLEELASSLYLLEKCVETLPMS